MKLSAAGCGGFKEAHDGDVHSLYLHLHRHMRSMFWGQRSTKVLPVVNEARRWYHFRCGTLRSLPHLGPEEDSRRARAGHSSTVCYRVTGVINVREQDIIGDLGLSERRTDGGCAQWLVREVEEKAKTVFDVIIQFS